MNARSGLIIISLWMIIAQIVNTQESAQICKSNSVIAGWINKDGRDLTQIEDNQLKGFKLIFSKVMYFETNETWFFYIYNATYGHIFANTNKLGKRKLLKLGRAKQWTFYHFLKEKNQIRLFENYHEVGLIDVTSLDIEQIRIRTNISMYWKVDVRKKYHRKSTKNESRQNFCSVPGKLGSNCDVDCEELLGPGLKYCQNHEICIEDHCICSWGFKGPYCEKDCPCGTWGLACENNCSSDCQNCNAITGINIYECKGDGNWIKSVVIVIVMMVITLVLFVGFLFWRKGKSDTEQQENKNCQKQAFLI